MAEKVGKGWTETEMINVVLADDHHIVRHGLQTLLDSQAELHVVGQASDGVETCQLVERLQPDVLVVDVMMGGMNGIEVTRNVRKLSPNTRVVVLSMHADEGYVMEALRAGAKGYVLKDSITEDLLHAIGEAMLDHRYLSPPVSEHIIEEYLQKSEGTAAKPYERLTVREREVFHLLTQGCNNAQIAARLCVSRRTIEVHRANMMRKLGLRSQVQLLRYAVQQGMLPVEK
jgi:DNA-binding NarL/FixJ family response regulator